MLKVWLYSYNNTKGDYNTISNIGEILNLTSNQVRNAIDNLLNCSFKDYSLFAKDYEKRRTNKGNITIGLVLQFTPNGLYNN